MTPPTVNPPDAMSPPAAVIAPVVSGTVAPSMTVEFTVIRDLAALRELDGAWRALAAAGGSGALFRGPDWVIPWWHAYHKVLGAELHVMAGRADGELVC